MADLSQIRKAIVDRDVPVLMDAAEVVTALDIPLRRVWETYENYVMDDGSATPRYLVRSFEVRTALLAMRPVRLVDLEVRRCRSCEAPLPPGARRFCSPRCARMTPTARAAYLENRASENPSVSAVVSTSDFPKPGVLMGGMTLPATLARPEASHV
jgi:hypothetical protein